MTEHLPDDRIAECVSGAPAPAGEQHLRECPQCASEVARLASALGHFRDAVRGLSEAQSASALARARAAHQRPKSRAWFRWPVLAAVALALAAAPAYRTVRDRRQAAQALADAQLLEQVNREVSESVPGPMEPLSQLVSWDSASQDSSPSSTASSSQNG